MKTLLLTLLFVLALAAPAAAHVTVLPDIARPGDTVHLTFRVPNERADAATNELQLYLPNGVPAQIDTHKGWTITNVGGGQVDFKARDAASAILPGRTQDFTLTLGPLPKVDRIAFKALQTYADGQVVRWIQTASPDDERPAAFLDLSGKGAGGKSGSAWPIIVGLVVFLLVVGGAVAVTIRRRRVI